MGREQQEDVCPGSIWNLLGKRDAPPQPRPGAVWGRRRLLPCMAAVCWAAAEGSKMSKGWAEELLQVQGLIWRASLSLRFGLKSSSRFRVWSEELLQV